MRKPVHAWQWSWAHAPNSERGDFIRSHARLCPPLTHEQIRELFLLTEDGVHAILDGADWHPSYQVRGPIPKQ